MTSYPSWMNRSQRWEPRNPAAHVINIRFMVAGIGVPSKVWMPGARLRHICAGFAEQSPGFVVLLAALAARMGRLANQVTRLLAIARLSHHSLCSRCGLGASLIPQTGANPQTTQSARTESQTY